MAGPYDTVIRLSVVDGVGPVLATLAASAMGVERTFSKLNGTMKATLAGGAAVLGGVEMLKGLKNLEEAGEKIVHVKTMFEAALPVQSRMADMAKITGAAWSEAGNNMRTTATENIAALHDLYNITQDVSHSIELLPGFNIMKNVLDSAKEKGIGGGSSDTAIAAAVQGLDIAGRTTMETLKPAAEALAATTIALGRRFDPQKYRTGILSSGDARFGWNDEFLTKGFAAIQALGGGNRTGSMMYQLNSNLFGGGGGALGSKIQADSQVKWGLHTADDQLWDGKKFKGFKVGSVFESDKLRANPVEWANDYRDKLKGMGVDTNDMKQMATIVGEIGRGNKLLKAALDELLLPTTNKQLNREIGNINKVGTDATDIINKDDPRAIHDALAKQWENVKAAIGESFVKPLMDGFLKPLTKVFSTISQWAAVNQPWVQNIGIAAAGLAGAFVVLGGSAVIGAMAMLVPGGMIAVGVTSLAAVVATLAAANWGGIKQAAADFQTSFAALNSAFASGVVAWRDKAISAITEVVNAIGAFISSAFQNLKSMIPGLSGPQVPAAPGTPWNHQLPPTQAPMTPPPQQHSSIQIPVTVNMDGRKMASVVTNQMVASATYPTSASGADGRGQWLGPSAYSTDQG